MATKRDKMGRALKKAPRTEQELQDLKRNIRSGQEALKKTIVILAREDIEWLDELVVHLKRARRKTSKSEVIRLSLKKLRKMTESEILNDLRFLE